MLEKAIMLHLKLVKSEIKVSAITMFLFALGITLISPSAFMVLIPLLVFSICMIKGLAKLFGRSLYGSEAELYQMLPLSARDILFGKVFAVVLWQAGMMIVLVVPLAAGLAVTDRLLTVDLVESYVQDLLIRGMTPWQIGILAGLIFVGILISEFAYCMFLVLVQILIRRLAPQFAKKMSDFTGIIIAGLIYSAVSSGFDALAKLVLPPEGTFYFVIAEYLLLIGIGAVLYRFCREHLERGFEQEYIG